MPGTEPWLCYPCGRKAFWRIWYAAVPIRWDAVPCLTEDQLAELHSARARWQDYYSHMVSAAVLVAPAQEHVIAMDPEFITLQDGHDKRDCEQQASKGWVKRNAERFAPWKAAILTGDVQSHQPLCELPQEHKLHFATA